MESPVEVWVSLSLATFSVIGFLPSEAASSTCVGHHFASMGEYFMGGFLSLLLLALFFAVLFYAARKPQERT